MVVTGPGISVKGGSVLFTRFSLGFVMIGNGNGQPPLTVEDNGPICGPWRGNCGHWGAALACVFEAGILFFLYCKQQMLFAVIKWIKAAPGWIFDFEKAYSLDSSESDCCQNLYFSDRRIPVIILISGVWFKAKTASDTLFSWLFSYVFPLSKNEFF